MEIRIYDLEKDDIIVFRDLVPDYIYDDKEMEYLAAVDESDVAAGILAWKWSPFTMNIEYIGVYPELQNNGIATGLVNALVQRVEDSARHYYIQATFPITDEYRSIYGIFSNNQDFVIGTGSTVKVITPEERSRLIGNEHLPHVEVDVKRFLDLDEKVREKFYSDLRQKNMELVTSEDEYDMIPELSLCYLSKEGEVETCLIMRKREEGAIELSFLITKSPRPLIGVITKATEIFEENYPEEILIMNTVNKESSRMAQKLFGETKNDYIIATALYMGSTEI